MEQFAVDELPGEYAALGDPVRVMAEVLRLVAELRRAAGRLGDAIAAAGFPARAWRGDDAWLPDLPGELPEITLDTLFTRLAEFAADAGPHWLRDGAEGVARFHEEAVVLYEAIRPMRAFAQRQRMLPARDRGDHPLWRALGDARVGTPLDIVAGRLRDLDALAEFTAPLSAAQWREVEAARTADTSPAEAARRSVPLADPATADAQLSSAGAAPAPAPAVAPDAAAPRRSLRDYVPAHQQDEAPPDPAPSSRPMGVLAAVRAALLARRWIVVGGAAMLLAMGTGLLTLAARGQEGPLPPPKLAYLQTTPASLTLACTGKGHVTTLVMQDVGTTPEVWSVTAPPGMTLSVSGGTLQPGKTVTISVTVAAAKAATGALTFTDQDGALAVPYTVTCGK